MKRKLLGVFLVLIGAGLWWTLSRTARLSIKKWDAKFDSVFRHSLSTLGFSNEDLVSSVHELKRDRSGEWVVHRVAVKDFDKARGEQLARDLERSGADVEERWENGVPVILVKRGSRIYQEIRLVKR